MSSPESKIDLTKPSRELDALVAEKVMGEQVRGTWIIDGVRPDGIPNRQCPVEHYSSDIAAAWEVVEKLDGEWKLQGHEGLGWEAGFDSSTGGMDAVIVSVEAMADTAPLAICVAALKAVGALITE